MSSLVAILNPIMKKHSFLLSSALLVTLAVPALIYAQDNQSAPAPQPKPNTITGHLQSEYQAGMQNLQNNRDYRNTLIPQEHYGSSSPSYASGTPPFRAGQTGVLPPNAQGRGPGIMPPSARSPVMMPALMKRFATSTMFASSTLIQQMTANHEREQSLRADAFAFLQDNLVQQSNQSLTNLQQIRARIASLIQTETAKGIDMSKATTLLATADKDISTAMQAVQALAAYVPSTGSTTITASTTIDLRQARQLGSAAIQSINAARMALDQVVSAIIQALGVPPIGSSTEAVLPSSH